MESLVEVKYPHLDRMLNLYPGAQILLGHEIAWTCKRDGSNLGCSLNMETGELQLRTRNMDNASPDFYRAFELSGMKDNVVGLLQDASNWGSEYVLFGEIMTPGKSPTRVEHHEKHEFVAFDLWTTKNERFVNYTYLHQQCHHFDIPVVELYGTSTSKDLEHLFAFKDEMLEIAKKNGREGVVGKVYAENKWNVGEEAGTKQGVIYFKEKLDTPRLEKLPRDIQEGGIQLPVLPDSEVYGAIEKVRADIGNDDFRNIKIAMPKVAEYVTIECKKHCCTAPPKIHAYYQQRLADLAVE